MHSCRTSSRQVIQILSLFLLREGHDDAPKAACPQAANTCVVPLRISLEWRLAHPFPVRPTIRVEWFSPWAVQGHLLSHGFGARETLARGGAQKVTKALQSRLLSGRTPGK